MTRARPGSLRGCHPAPRPGRGAFRHAGGRFANARGYTLLEVLVAFTLLAIGLGLLLSILSGGIRAIATASDSTRASLYAESFFDSLGADRRLAPGHSAGSFEGGRYRWTLDIAIYPLPAPATAAGGAVAPVAGDGTAENQLLDLVLQVQWNGGGPGNALRVETLRAYTPAPVATP